MPLDRDCFEAEQDVEQFQAYYSDDLPVDFYLGETQPPARKSMMPHVFDYHLKYLPSNLASPSPANSPASY